MIDEFRIFKNTFSESFFFENKENEGLKSLVKNLTVCLTKMDDKVYGGEVENKE